MLPTDVFFADLAGVVAQLSEKDRPRMQALVDELELIAQREPRASDRCYAYQARILAKMRNFEQALAAVERALQLMPVDEGLIVLRGDIYRQAQDYPHAVQDYTKVLTTNSEAVTALMHRAEIYLQNMNNPEAALEDIAQALKHEPRSLRLIYLRAQTLLGLNRTREAIADFSTVVQLCPKGQPLRNDAKERLRELGVR